MQLNSGASHTIKASKASKTYQLSGIEKAYPSHIHRLGVFGKPETKEGRRMAVVLSTGESVNEAREKVELAASKIMVTYNE